METALRPRDIQVRIRAGESPEAVAAAAGTTVEKIMGFAMPVLAERAYVAQQAQSASVRRRLSGGSIGHLGEAVAAHLETLDIDPESIEWDSWKREDRKWVLQATYTAQGSQVEARFVYDAAGRYVTADDDAARALVDERPPAPAAVPEADNPHRASDDIFSPRSLVAVVGNATTAQPSPEGDASLARGETLDISLEDAATGSQVESYDDPAQLRIPEDAVAAFRAPTLTPPGTGEADGSLAGAEGEAPPTKGSFVSRRTRRWASATEPVHPVSDDFEPTADLTQTVAAIRSLRPDEDEADAATPTSEPPQGMPSQQRLTGLSRRRKTVHERAGDDDPGFLGALFGVDEIETAAGEDPATAGPAPKAGSSKSKPRASVPSWDEIMFGGSTTRE